jgi:hypothetical protein
MTELGRNALKYAENNAIITKNIFQESASLGGTTVGALANQSLGWTIGLPEKIARFSTFMTFVHHLEQSKKFTSQMELFRKAKEMTDHSLTSFNKMDRPMVVDKLGATGALAYTFKSYLFNYFHQLSQLSREAIRGTPTPLMTHMASLVVVGGALSIPLVNEMDGLWNVFKDMMAAHVPQHYDIVKGNGLKATMISKLGDTGAYGAASSMLGVALQNRFGTDFADPEHPLKNIFPVAQDIKEAVSSAAALTHPNKTTASEAVYQQMPAMVKGQMETHMDVYKGAKQGKNQTAVNPNDLLEHRAINPVRTPDDWNKRKYGVTSLHEARSRQENYINDQESHRIKVATEALAKFTYDAIVRGDSKDIQYYAKKYVELNPENGALESEIQSRALQHNLSPEQRHLINATTAQAVLNAKRLIDSRK